MANEINRRDVLKTLGGISLSMALQPLPKLFAQSKKAAGRLILHFNGLWAYVVGQNGMTAVTARVGEHAYRAGGERLSEGHYALGGVKNGGRPALDHELIIYGAGQVDLPSSYAWMEMPFPKEVVAPPCTVNAEFSGPDACVRSRSFPLVHQLHYDVAPTAPLSFGSIEIPPPGANSEIHIKITAEPPARLGNRQHPYAAFDKLIALFPGLNLKLEKISINPGCAGVDSYSHPENCIQSFMLASRCPDK